MSIDRLHSLLQRFPIRAHAVHAGPLCGLHEFQPRPGIGQLHLVRRGSVEAWHGQATRDCLDAPCLVFYPLPLQHRFITDAEQGADMACADIEFAAGDASPLAQALPPVLVMPLADLPGAAAVLELLFDEAFASRCGRQQLIDRLFEVVVLLLLRRLIDSGRIAEGTLAGLADPQLARALVAMFDRPAHPWTLDRLAATAGMSRSRFADAFARTVGATPAAYLARYRVALAQDLLRRGRGLERIAEEVGYGSASALSRAFSAVCGLSPRRWRAAASAGADRPRAVTDRPRSQSVPKFAAP
jgi:AraC-like DNA-binding protein